MAKRLVWTGLHTLALGLALAVGAAGCGSGGGGPPPFAGTLEVTNDAFSSDGLDSIDIDEVGGPDHFSFDVFLAPGESFDVDLFPDSYDVTIFWNDGSYEVHPVDIFNGYTTFLPVSN